MLLQETTSDYETKLTVMREDMIDQKIRFESEVKGLQDELLMTQGDLDTTNSQKESRNTYHTGPQRVPHKNDIE